MPFRRCRARRRAATSIPDLEPDPDVDHRHVHRGLRRRPRALRQRVRATCRRRRPVHRTATATGPGIPNCPISLTGTGAVEDNNRTLRLPYSGTTCLGPVSGTEVLRKPAPAAAEPPAPPAAPLPPAPPPPAAPIDGIDLHGVTVTASSPADVANWPVTTLITTLDLRSDGAFVNFSKKDGPYRWPDVTPPGWDGPIQYTLWLVENINGRWYTSGGVEYWYGLGRQGGPPSQFGRNWSYSPEVWGPIANRQPRGRRAGRLLHHGGRRARPQRHRRPRTLQRRHGAVPERRRRDVRLQRRTLRAPSPS